MTDYGKLLTEAQKSNSPDKLDEIAKLADEELCKPSWEWQQANGFFGGKQDHPLPNALEAMALVGAKVEVNNRNPMLAMLGSDLVGVIKSALIMGYALAKTGILENGDIPKPFKEALDS